MSTPTESTTDLIFAAGQCDIEAKAAKLPTISIMAYGGGLMRLPGWGDVVIDLPGLDASGSIALLADHDNQINSILGQGQATIKAGKLYVGGTLPPVTESAKRVIELARSGFHFQASIGAEVVRRERVRAGEPVNVNGRTIQSEADFTIIRAAKLREVSILALGADDSTSVEIQARKNMNENNTSSATSTVNPDLERIEAMAKVCDGYPAIEAKAIEENWSLVKARGAVLEALRDSRAKAPAAHIYGGMSDLTAEVLEVSQALRCGVNVEKHYKPQVIEAARRNPVNSLVDLCRAVCVLNGAPIPGDRNELIRASSGFTSMGLSGILGNVANKSLLQSYQATPSVARLVCGPGNASDFKENTAYRMSGDFALEEIGSNGEMAHVTDMDESSYTFQLGTYARTIVLTRQALINDDLNAFDQIPRLFGVGAARTIEKLFWTLVLANASSFFSGGHLNLLTDALDGDGLSAGVTLFLRQTDAQGEPINSQPRYLVVPPELLTMGQELFASRVWNAGPSSASDTDRLTTANAHVGRYEPLCAPHISNSAYTNFSQSRWFLFGDPANIPAYTLAFLNGQSAPTIESGETDFSTLGMQWRAYCDFAIAEADPKGAVMSSGTT